MKLGHCSQTNIGTAGGGINVIEFVEDSSAIEVANRGALLVAGVDSTNLCMETGDTCALLPVQRLVVDFIAVVMAGGRSSWAVLADLFCGFGPTVDRPFVGVLAVDENEEDEEVDADE